jgi:hypothetical protein
MASPQPGETVDPIRVVAWNPPRIELDIRATITKLGAVWSALGEGVALLVAWLIPLAAVVGFEACRRVLFESGAGCYSWKDYTAWTVGFLVWICFGVFAIGLFVAGYEVARETARDVRRDLKHRGARRISIDRERIAIETTTRREIPGRDVDGVVLRTHEVRRDRWSELELVLADDDVLLAATQALDETAQANLQALAIGIARVLDVPYPIEDRDQPTAA